MTPSSELLCGPYVISYLILFVPSIVLSAKHTDILGCDLPRTLLTETFQHHKIYNGNPERTTYARQMYTQLIFVIAPGCHQT